MILSSADILRILGGSEIVRLTSKLSIVDGKPALSGAEGIRVYINRFPSLTEFESTWQIWIEADEEDDLVVAELKRLLPKVQVTRGLMTTITTTEFRSESTQAAPEASRTQPVQVDLTQYEERFQALVEDVQDQMLLVTNGRPGRDGQDGRDGVNGRDGRDIEATETELEDLANVEQIIAKENGQVLTWKDGRWQNLFIPQIVSSIGPSGGGGDTTNTSLIGRGIWRYSPSTAGDPSTGRIQYNNSDPSLATEIYISRYTDERKDIYNLLTALVLVGTVLYTQGGDADNYYLYDVTANAVQVGGTHITVQVLLRNQGLDAGFANNEQVGLASYNVGGGGGTAGGAIVINDLLDVDTSTVPPAIDQALIWNGSRWVPGAIPDTGIPEAPQDNNYYVRHNGSWVSLSEALAALDDRTIDGGNFTTGVSTGDSEVIDGGNFS